MRVYSWNVMGIKATKFGEFLEDFGKEVSWDVIVLQEFTAAKDVEVFMNKSAHKVILTSPVEGSRACGIVIHQNIKHCIIPRSSIFKARAASICIHWEGWNIKIVSGHLTPDHSKDNYINSINDIKDIIDEKDQTRELFKKTKHFDRARLSGPIYHILGIDAQVSVGPPDTREEGLYIGTSVMRGKQRTWKTYNFIQFILDYKLTLCNTFSKNTEDIFTCGYYLKSEPNQIDYVLSDFPNCVMKESGCHQSAATITDHRSVYASFIGKWWREVRRIPKKRVAPPLNWSQNDPEYHSKIRRDLKIEEPRTFLENLATKIFTDGSFAKAYKRKRGFAGWVLQCSIGVLRSLRKTPSKRNVGQCTRPKTRKDISERKKRATTLVKSQRLSRRQFGFWNKYRGRQITPTVYSADLLRFIRIPDMWKRFCWEERRQKKIWLYVNS